jgi:uncharacterized protein (TIGR00266 family)
MEQATASLARSNSALATGGLRFDINHRPDFAILGVKLTQGQKVLAEPSAMATMDPTIELKAGMRGGFGKSLGRLLGGESFIVNTFTAHAGPGEVTLAPGTPGDVVHYRLSGNSLMLQRGSFLAHSEGVEVSGKWQGARGFFSGEGLVLLKAEGTGDLFFNSYGAILEIDVTQGFLVDTGYVVAFEDTLQYNVTVMPGLRPGSKVKSFLFGGEGLVCRFSGRGKVWVQTRTAAPFLRWVHPFRPVQKQGG